MNGFGFLNFTLLWIIPVGLVLFLLIRLEGLRDARLNILGVKTKRATLLRARLVLPLIITTILSGAMLRPYYGFSESERRLPTHDIFLVLDVSRSMLAKDTPPSRLELAKRKVQDLIGLLQNKSIPARIGILLFSGSAYLYCPLTSDLAVVQTYLNSVSPDLISRPGSGLNQAMKVLVKAVTDSKSQKPFVLLISDGEDLSLDLDSAVQAVTQAGLSVNTLGIGTLEGQPIELRGGQFVKDSRGEIVISKLTEENLKSLATDSSGRYERFSLDDSDLESLVSSELAQSRADSLSSLSTEKIRTYNELGPALVIAAILIIIFALLRGQGGLIFTITLCIFVRELRAQDGYKAATLYEKGQYQESEREFKEALKSAPADAKLLQGLGSSQYRLKKFAEAKKSYSELVNSATNTTQKFEALHDLGNTNFMLKDYKGAIDAYEEALRLSASEAETSHNLELAKKLLAEQQQQEQQKQDQKEDQKEDKKNKQKEEQPQQEQEDPQKDTQPSDRQESTSSEGSGSSSSEQSSSTEANSSSSASSQDDSTAEDSSSSSEAQRQDSSTQGQSAKPKPSVEPLEKSESKAWLDSLDDSPLLLRKSDERSQTLGGQTW